VYRPTHACRAIALVLYVYELGLHSRTNGIINDLTNGLDRCGDTFKGFDFDQFYCLMKKTSTDNENCTKLNMHQRSSKLILLKLELV